MYSRYGSRRPKGSYANPIDLEDPIEEDFSEEEILSDVDESDEERAERIREFRLLNGVGTSKKPTEIAEYDMSPDNLSDAPSLEDYMCKVTSNLSNLCEELPSYQFSVSKDTLSVFLLLEEQLKNASSIVKKKSRELKEAYLSETLSAKGKEPTSKVPISLSKAPGQSKKLPKSTPLNLSSITEASNNGLKPQPSKIIDSAKGLSTLSGVQLEPAKRPGLTRTVTIMEDTTVPRPLKKVKPLGSQTTVESGPLPSKIMDTMEENYGCRPFYKSSTTGSAPSSTKVDMSTSSLAESSLPATSLPQPGTQEPQQTPSQHSDDELQVSSLLEPTVAQAISTVKNGISVRHSAKKEHK